MNAVRAAASRAGAWVNVPVLGRAQIDALKYIALLLMVADHLCFLPQMPHDAAMALTYISRLVFPVFAFLVTYHFVHHTRDKTAYLLRILAFAFIAEGPYAQLKNLSGEPVWYMSNILFSLGLGMATLIWIEWLARFPDVPFFEHHKTKNLLPVKWLAALLGACAIFTMSLFVDYTFFGVAVMVSYYLWLTRPGEATRNAAVFFTFLTNIPSGVLVAAAGLAFFALASLIVMVGEARLSWVPNPNRWFFYAFYPAHLLAIYIMGVFL